MSFSFAFSTEDESGDSEQPGDCEVVPPSSAEFPSSSSSIPSISLPLSSLLSSLPGRLSYSTVKVGNIVIPRRDLFDARFQMISEGEEAIGVESDLIPGTYEGGLKTWECSLDLVGVLEDLGRKTSYHGKRIVELGCGTALPSLYIFQHLLTTTPTSEPTYLHLCDFNTHVLSLVTLPNLLLAYYFASQERFEEAGEVEVTDDLVEAFLATLRQRNVLLSFHAGPWEGLDLRDRGEPLQSGPGTDTRPTADLVLTSETTYNPIAIPSLIQVMKGISRPSPSTEASQLPMALSSQQATTCLIATKNYYFGLGGGVHAFLSALQEEDKGRGWKYVTREESTVRGGVARCVLSLAWTVRE